VRVGPATISIQIADAARKSLSGATVEVEANMAHPGMAPVFGSVAETSPGNYRAQLRFAMSGDWVVSLRIKLPDGQTVEKTIDVRGIQPD
jgi:YtkA-like